VDHIVNAIEKVRSTLAKASKGSGFTEAKTVAGLIAPMLHVLGWDGFESIEYEYPVKGGKAVDLALILDTKPAVFVEAKAYAGTAAGNISDKSAGQAISYGAIEGVEWCLLTNGVRYELYYTTLPVTLHHKLVFQADLLTDPPLAVARKLALLSRSAVQDGTLHREGPRALVETRLREWCREADADVVALVRSKLGGAKIDDDAIAVVLRRLVAPSQENGPVEQEGPVQGGTGDAHRPGPPPPDLRSGQMAISRPIKVSGGYIRPLRYRETDGKTICERIPEADFLPIVAACCRLHAEGKELTTAAVRAEAFSEKTDRTYWSSVRGLGVLWAIGALDYVGGKGPQRFRLKEGMAEGSIQALFQAAVDEDASS